jgi:hypothetical protein
LREQSPQEQWIAIFDSGGYSESNIKSYNLAKIWWISRVPETSTITKSVLEEEYEQWQLLSDRSGEYVVRTMDLPQGKERWIIVRKNARLLATKEHMDKPATSPSTRSSSAWSSLFSILFFSLRKLRNVSGNKTDSENPPSVISFYSFYFDFLLIYC